LRNKEFKSKKNNQDDDDKPIEEPKKMSINELFASRLEKEEKELKKSNKKAKRDKGIKKDKEDLDFDEQEVLFADDDAKCDKVCYTEEKHGEDSDDDLFNPGVTSFKRQDPSKPNEPRELKKLLEDVNRKEAEGEDSDSELDDEEFDKLDQEDPKILAERYKEMCRINGINVANMDDYNDSNDVELADDNVEWIDSAGNKADKRVDTDDMSLDSDGHNK